MRQERTLYFPFVTLDEKALAELAGRLEGMAADERASTEARFRKERHRYSKETSEAYEERAKEYVRNFGPHARYSIALADGGLSDDNWAGLWERTSPSDLRAITMRSEGPSGLTVDGRINLKPDLTSYLDIASNDLENFRAEVGWLEDYFKRHRSSDRKTLSIREPGGLLLWYLVPLIGAGAIVVRLVAADSGVAS